MTEEESYKLGYKNGVDAILKKILSEAENIDVNGTDISIARQSVKVVEKLVLMAKEGLYE